MPISNYPHGFSNGITIRNLPLIFTQAKDSNVFWVDSTTGSNGNKGTFIKPLATIDYAVGLCTANKGDTIIVAAGHTETVTAAHGLDLNVAGITIVCLGEGTDKATITFTTSVLASMRVWSNNITLINPRFLTGIDALDAAILVYGSNFKLLNAEYYDAPAKAVVRVMEINNDASNLCIDGYKYYASTTGNQKSNQFQFGTPSNVTLRNIDIVGDFSVACINAPAAMTNLQMDGVKLNNENVTPFPGMILHANSTGMAKNVDIRIASGTTYVSSVAKLNWDNNCLGYNADGTGGDPIGTAGTGTLEAKSDAIQADIGDPSSRTNFQSLEAMIGIPDAANSSLDDIIRTGFSSASTTDNADGSVLERQEAIQVSAGLNVNSTTTDNLHGKLGTDTEMEDRSVFDLLGGDGFASYPVAAAPGNDVSLAEVARAIYDDTNSISGISLPVDPVANSLASFIASGGTALGTELADSKSIVDAIGSDGATLAYGVGSALGAIGTVHVIKKTLISSNIVQAGVDVTAASAGGDLMIEEIYMNTDATGLAAGTNFQLETNNANGVTVFFAETVANLGANKTETIGIGSVTSIYGTVLESGKKIIAKSTVADCTGAGTITLVIKLRRIAAGATVAAA